MVGRKIHTRKQHLAERMWYIGTLAYLLIYQLARLLTFINFVILGTFQPDVVLDFFEMFIIYCIITNTSFIPNELRRKCDASVIPVSFYLIPDT